MKQYNKRWLDSFYRNKGLIDILLLLESIVPVALISHGYSNEIKS